MTIENQENNVLDQTSDANQEQQTPTQETEQVRDPEGVLKKNRELLAKLKSEREKAEEYQRRLDEIEQEKLASTGKKDELIDALKKQLKERDEKLKTTTQSYAMKSVRSQVLDAARAMGCEKPDVVFKLADLSSVPVNDDFSVDSDALKSALEGVMEEVPQLFKRTPAAPRDGTPKPVDTGEKPLSQMSVAELTEMYKKAALGGS